MGWNNAGWVQDGGWYLNKVVAAAYTGPGDVVASAYAWWGLRGYTAAYSTGSNPAVDLVDQAGLNPITINILSNGTLDVASISAWVTANTVTTIKVTKLYDQTGGTRHLVQATLATMPVLVLGPVTGLASNRPAMVFANAQFLGRATAFGIAAQPLSMSCVSIRTSGTTDVGMLAGATGNDAEMILQGATVASIFAGSPLLTATTTNNAWHSFHGVFSGASSAMNVDGANTTGTTGTGAINATGINLGRDSFSASGSWWVGNINEGGVYASALTPTNMTNLSSNQHSYWGY